ncbi:MAG: hypothetical protein CO189_06955 [candidate division Zixibacteria bacterium CG_4_9_14_3_um_filter_46_8]|nr:MAG: hypothetical protein CO189_06955 [candidate division Zixibacteria bacterium CG_4_9_14_3_um_filter_46_8]
MRYLIIFALLAASLTSCNENPTYVPYDDRTAIVDIVAKDYPNLFQTLVVNADVPDTTLHLTSGSYKPLFYWREIIDHGRKYDINAIYPDSLGIVPYATVTVTESIRINFHVIASDTTAIPDSIVRIVKPATELIRVAARMEQWGNQYDARNGWLLQKASPVFGSSTILPYGILKVTLSSLSIGEKLYSSSDYLRLDSLNQIPIVRKNETINVTVQVSDPSDIITFHIGKDVFAQTSPTPIDSNRFQAILVSPDQVGYFHITIDLIDDVAIPDTANYQFQRWSLPLHILNN